MYNMEVLNNPTVEKDLRWGFIGVKVNKNWVLKMIEDRNPDSYIDNEDGLDSDDLFKINSNLISLSMFIEKCINNGFYDKLEEGINNHLEQITPYYLKDEMDVKLKMPKLVRNLSGLPITMPTQSPSTDEDDEKRRPSTPKKSFKQDMCKVYYINFTDNCEVCFDNGCENNDGYAELQVVRKVSQCGTTATECWVAPKKKFFEQTDIQNMIGGFIAVYKKNRKYTYFGDQEYIAKELSVNSAFNLTNDDGSLVCGNIIKVPNNLLDWTM